MHQATPNVIDMPEYEKGYQARLEGQHLSIFSDWACVSWREGWSAAGKYLAQHPEITVAPKRKVRKKGSK